MYRFSGIKCKADIIFCGGLISSYPNKLEKTRLGRQQGLKWTVFCNHISEAKKYAHNGQVAIAEDVKRDGKRVMKGIIDRLNTDVLKASVCAEEDS